MTTNQPNIAKSNSIAMAIATRFTGIVVLQHIRCAIQPIEIPEPYVTIMTMKGPHNRPKIRLPWISISRNHAINAAHIGNVIAAGQPINLIAIDVATRRASLDSNVPSSSISIPISRHC